MKIRSYQPGDEKQILELDWQLFPDPWNKRDVPNWKWKHLGSNPAGKALVYVMEHEGKIIVHFAVVPYRIRYFGEDILASHSIGSMVAPEYQGKGLIKFVADKLFEEAVTRNIAFSYGFPNGLAYDLHIKLMGYRDLMPIATLERSADGKISESTKGLKFLAINNFGPAVDKLWDAGKDTYQISVIRDAAFLNWRYLARPDQKYRAFGAYEAERLVGYIVLKLYRDELVLKGHIIDLFTLPRREDVARFLIEEGLNFFAKNGTNLESSWVAGSALYERLLTEKGFKPVCSRPLICRLNFDKEKYQRALNGANWYFTMGDSTEIY